MGADTGPRCVVLMGPKHSGKTSVGNALARLYGGTFIDLDDSIRAITGKTPRELYEAGPQVFRDAEAIAAAAVVSEPGAGGIGSAPTPSPLIIAAGGGLIDNERALSSLQRETVLICLDTDADTAWERILRASEKGGGLPPFLRTEHPRQTHRDLHERRMRSYRLVCDRTVDTEGKRIVDIAAEIAAAFPEIFEK